MRYIVYGVGAIGGTFAGALMQAGFPVIGIARGAMLAAIARDGLLFRTPAGDERIKLPVVGAPSEIGFAADDVILLTTKSQDTAAAVLALRDAGVAQQAVICAQNGVANERAALRLFPNVYGMTVMMPSDYTVPGEVICYGEPKHGLLDLGRYPGGSDAVVDAVAAELESAGFAVATTAEVMRSKYGKLFENLGNVIEAALGPGVRAAEAQALARAEAKLALRAAGITDWLDVSRDNARRAGVMELGTVAGAKRSGGSSAQSLRRGAGSIETDYLNGEIVLLGRLHGVPTPINAALCAIGRELVSAGVQPGSFTVAALTHRLGIVV